MAKRPQDNSTYFLTLRLQRVAGVAPQVRGHEGAFALVPGRTSSSLAIEPDALSDVADLRGELPAYGETATAFPSFTAPTPARTEVATGARAMLQTPSSTHLSLGVQREAAGASIQ